MKQRKSKKAEPSQNQRNNARLEEAARQLTQVTLVSDGTLLGLHRDVLGLIFSRLPTQKDRLSFASANRQLRYIHSEWLNRRFGLANDQQRSAAFAAQQKEIDYLLDNEDEILSDIFNKNDQILISCFKRLAQIKDAKLEPRKVSQTEYHDMTPFGHREEILNELNARIVRIRIDQSIVLDCSSCHLTRFPRSLLTDPTLREYWSKLRVLTLKSNQLTTLPPEIGLLGVLYLLELEHNQLTALPPEIGQLGLLDTLYLEHNQLTALPPEIGQLGKLTILRLSNNQLTALPPEIEQLGSLILLGVNYNRLTKLPDIIREENKAEVLATQTPPQVEQEASPKRNRLLQQ